LIFPDTFDLPPFLFRLGQKRGLVTVFVKRETERYKLFPDRRTLLNRLPAGAGVASPSPQRASAKIPGERTTLIEKNEPDVLTSRTVREYVAVAALTLVNVCSVRDPRNMANSRVRLVGPAGP